jgi:hypothetical protein
MIKWPTTCSCCNPLVPCPTGDLGIWIADDLGLLTHSFVIKVNGRLIKNNLGNPVWLTLGSGGGYAGQLIIPERFSSFTKAQCEFPAALPPTPAMTDFIAGGVNTQLHFSPNIPVIAEFSAYHIILDSINWSNVGNIGSMTLFQVCEAQGDGHPIMNRIMGDSAFGGGPETTIPFDINTIACGVCVSPLCDLVLSAAGGDEGYCRDWGAPAAGTTIRFVITTYTQKDRIIVTSNPTNPRSPTVAAATGTVLFDTGCVGITGVTFNALVPTGSRVIRIIVIPNCEGGSGTAWNFTSTCIPP